MAVAAFGDFTQIRDDQTILEELTEITNRLSLLTSAIPPGEVYPDLLAAWSRWRWELGRLINTRLEDAAYTQVGKLQALMAHASSDMNDRRGAAAHLKIAKDFAKRSQDPLLIVYLAWIESNELYWERNYVKARSLVRSARPYAQHPSTNLRLTCQEGRILAKLGAVDESVGAIEEARSLLDLSNATSADGLGVLSFSRGKALYYISEIQMGISNFNDAREYAQRALSELVKDPDSLSAPEFQVAARLDLVNAILATSGVQDAWIEIEILAAMPSEIVTIPIEERLRTLLAGLSHADDSMTGHLARSMKKVLDRPARKAAILPVQMRT